LHANFQGATIAAEFPQTICIAGTTPMATGGSVTHWLHLLGAGDAAAAQRLRERYIDRLVRLAGQKLRGTPRRVADEEDVALSVFDSFCQGVARGRFPQLRDRDNLWGLLVLITARKAVNLVRHERRQKRGGGRVVTDATQPGSADSSDVESPIDLIVGREPTPEFAAQVAEEYWRLLNRLGDGNLRQIAIWKMEGFANTEIAAKLGRSEPTVERRLRLIRKTWDEETPDGQV
jgi:DNA-directed RNA polymerase specialized sigma24 family protein